MSRIVVEMSAAGVDATLAHRKATRPANKKGASAQCRALPREMRATSPGLETRPAGSVYLGQHERASFDAL
jgi:hypothetical protein